MAKSKGGPTPVMQQFFRAKEQHPDALLFFRMGDFYEFFYEDAIESARLLDLTLTSRSKSSNDEPIPMAGVPHHAASGYIARLLEMGRKVAVCEQMADPSTVKGIVPREVVRVVTPGLVLDPEVLDARAHHYLVAVCETEGVWGLACFELSTSELRAAQLPDATAALAELVRLEPRELLLKGGAKALEVTVGRLLPRCTLSPFVEPSLLATTLGNVEGCAPTLWSEAGLSSVASEAAEQVLAYAAVNQPKQPLGVPRVLAYDPSEQLGLDEAAVRNLEVVRTLAGERRGSLLSIVDQTRTSMGARLLRRRLLAPLVDVAAIRRRHDAVDELARDASLRARVREALTGIGDLERLATRVAARVATPKELAAIRDALSRAAQLATLVAETAGPGAREVLAIEDGCEDVFAQLAENLVPEPPASSGGGGIVRDGANADVDELRQIAHSGKQVLLELEARERERTGIGSLKVKYTRVFGYYIEVTRANLGSVPSDYRRKQTIANGERFVTEELDDLQRKIESADDRLAVLEAELFEQLREGLCQHVSRLSALASRLSDIDVHQGFAELAHRFDYVRPQVDTSSQLSFSELRHPVVERLAESGTFVPNDITLDADSTRLMIITGPNMSGKSTTMRQVAVATLLAQAGSFVPARSAHVGVVDRIYTRVGASDNLAGGQSTFMVEMQEAANILRGATRRSLVILDELGRGTSTYDGLAIAWSIAENLHDLVGCRAMFATHYHELCELAQSRRGVANFNVAAREYGDEVVFLHKLVEGGANRSYGIAVAKLAGVPEGVLARARALLRMLEHGHSVGEGARADDGQLDLFRSPPAQPSEVEATLREVEVEQLRPVDALLLVEQLKALLPEAPSG